MHVDGILNLNDLFDTNERTFHSSEKMKQQT
jgi:hypothetical protein